MVDLACDDDAMRRALLHVCWRWEWPSYVAIREIQSQIEDEDHMDHMHGYLRLMESLMALDDWAQERRVRLCLEGPTEVQFPDGEKKDAPHLQAAYDAITGLVDETVIVCLAPLSATPYVADQAMGMNAPLREPLLDLVDGIAGRVNQVLARRLDARPDVLVVDGFELWRSVSNPVFLDDVHPTSATGQSLAGAVAGLIHASDLQSFGFT